MHRVGKVVPPKREILKDISLSFFPGAKIGVPGLNGSGKGAHGRHGSIRAVRAVAARAGRLLQGLW